MIRTCWVVLRVEALTLLRMPEAYTFGILPATLAVPVLLALMVLLASFQREPVLALPLIDPPGLDLAEGLDDDWSLVRVAEPSVEVAHGRAQAAVASWRVGPAEGAWLEVEAVVADGDARDRLEDSLERTTTEQLDDRIEAARGDPDLDRRVGRVTRGALRASIESLSPRFALVAFASFMAGYLGCFIVPVRTTVERLSGALEAMSVAATPLVVVYAARVVVCAAYGEIVALMPVGTTALLVWSAGLEVPAIAPLDLVELYAALLVFYAAFVLCGVAANSVRVSLYLASYAILAALPLLGLPFWTELPWMPVVGLASDAGALVQLGRIGLTLAVAGAAVALAGRVARLDRAMPVAGAGE